MSLRAIHICVISLSILLLFFFGNWAIASCRTSGNPAYFYLGVASTLAGILLAVYLVWFIIKVRKK